MHYLECLALLKYLSDKLYAKQRIQVPVNVTQDVLQVTATVNQKLSKEIHPEISMRIRDIMETVTTVKLAQGMLYLTEAMKDALVSGVEELQSEISLLAFDYFKVHDFEPTQEIIPIMRGVVSVALSKGVL